MALVDIRSQAQQHDSQGMVNHLNSFDLDLKFSAGIWFFSPANSRFHEKYTDDLPLEARLDIAASLKDYGLDALEAHYPNEINEDNIDLWKQFTADTGIRVSVVCPGTILTPMIKNKINRWSGP